MMRDGQRAIAGLVEDWYGEPIHVLKEREHSRSSIEIDWCVYQPCFFFVVWDFLVFEAIFSQTPRRSEGAAGVEAILRRGNVIYAKAFRGGDESAQFARRGIDACAQIRRVGRRFLPGEERLGEFRSEGLGDIEAISVSMSTMTCVTPSYF